MQNARWKASELELLLTADNLLSFVRLGEQLPPLKVQLLPKTASVREATPKGGHSPATAAPLAVARSELKDLQLELKFTHSASSPSEVADVDHSTSQSCILDLAGGG